MTFKGHNKIFCGLGTGAWIALFCKEQPSTMCELHDGVWSLNDCVHENYICFLLHIG